MQQKRQNQIDADSEHLAGWRFELAGHRVVPAHGLGPLIAVGNYTVKANYKGDDNYSEAEGSGVFAVEPADSEAKITNCPSSVPAGQPASFIVNVQWSNPPTAIAAAEPPGQVQLVVPHSPHSPFAGPANVTAWDNQRKLYYYQQGVGFFSCALNSVGLLTQPNGSGQCGAWQHLFLDSLAVNGIIGSQTSITTVDGTLFLVKDWNYGAPSSPSTPPYYWRETFPLENGNCCGMVPVSLVSGDLTSLSTLYGQNTAPPSEKLFARHFIVKAPAGLSVGGPYFDPSYGVTYQSNCDFEGKAVAGYAVLAGQPIPPTQVIAVRQPTGSCNISFSN